MIFRAVKHALIFFLPSTISTDTRVYNKDYLSCLDSTVYDCIVYSIDEIVFHQYRPRRLRRMFNHKI